MFQGSSRSSSRKSSVDQGYNPPPPPPQEDDDSGCFILKIIAVIGILGAVFGAGIGVGSAIWNEECEVTVAPPTQPMPDFTEDYTGTIGTELVTGTEAITGTGTMETVTIGLRLKS